MANRQTNEASFFIEKRTNACISHYSLHRLNKWVFLFDISQNICRDLLETAIVSFSSFLPPLNYNICYCFLFLRFRLCVLTSSTTKPPLSEVPSSSSPRPLTPPKPPSPPPTDATMSRNSVSSRDELDRVGAADQKNASLLDSSTSIKGNQRHVWIRAYILRHRVSGFLKHFWRARSELLMAWH